MVPAYLVREPEQVGLRVVGEHPVHGIHQLLQEQEEELLGHPARVHRLLPVKDHLVERGWSRTSDSSIPFCIPI